jgi:PTH1 family peptidyl-tRNA hydrolase
VKLIVGLGNPGIEYQFTPHNIGFLAVDRIAEQCGVMIDNRHSKALTARTRIGNEEILLAKPETFMNLSGMSVLELVRKYEVDPQQGVLVIYDELDLPLGMIRVRARGSSAGHNGMQSIINALQTEEIARIRIGVAPLPIHAKTGRERGPADDPRKGGAKYILSPFRKSQLVAVDEALELTAQAVNVMVNESILIAMNRFNRKNTQDDEEQDM